MSRVILFCWLCCSAFSAQLTTSVLVSTNHKCATLFLNLPQPPLSCNAVNDSSLKAYWKLDEASGGAIDSKGSNNLTENGVVDSSFGKIGTGRSFSSAIGNWFSIPDNSDLAGGDFDFTVGAWGFPTLQGSVPSVMAKFPAAGNFEYNLLLDNQDTNASYFKFYVSSDGTTLTNVTSTTPVINTWVYVIAWHDSVNNSLNIQVNNGQVDSIPYSAGVFHGTGDFYLGKDENNNGNWNGFLDEAFFTRRVLLPYERAALFNEGLACRPSGL